MATDINNKRLLITLPIGVVKELEKNSTETNLTKSQLITLCVKRSLYTVAKDYKEPETK